MTTLTDELPYGVIARYSATDYLKAVTKHDVPLSDCGYYAAWIDSDGFVLAVDYHHAAGEYGTCYERGWVRVVVAYQLGSETSLSGEGINAKQLRTFAKLFDGRESSAGYLDMTMSRRICGRFNSVDELCQKLQEA